MKLRILKYLALLLAPLGLLLSCEKQPVEPVEPSGTDARIIHYRATVTKGVDTRVSLSGLSYQFSEGDQLYVINTDEGDDAGKLYGVMHLVSGAGTGTAVFEGDLYVDDDEFIPSDSTPLSVTLVGAGDLLHTCADGKVTGTGYGNSLYASSLECAVAQYSHFIATGTFADRYFTLFQKSTFINVSITFAETETAENASVTLYNNTSVSLWSHSVSINSQSHLASFTAVLDGTSGVTLNNALLSVTPARISAPSYSFDVTPVTLTANYYYNIARTAIQAETSTLFTIEAPQATTVTFNYTTGLEYSSDGLNWSSYSSGIPMDADDVLYFRATGTSYRNSDGSTPLFTTDDDGEGNPKSVYIYGDIMSLMSGNTEVPANAFEGTFKNVTWISIPNDKSLTLSATTLNGACYKEMFKGSSINKVPVLSASTLAANCYESMFEGCTALISAPTLSATSLAASCYKAMFKGCTGITAFPELPATILAESCYESMFEGCTELISAPTLSATSLAASCYKAMFKGCTGITAAPALMAMTLYSGCYQDMFNGCTSLTGSILLPASTLADNCYNGMFNGASSVNEIICLATDRSATGCTNNWVSGVAAEGSFWKAPGSGEWGTGVSAIPNGWVVKDYGAPIFPGGPFDGEIDL